MANNLKYCVSLLEDNEEHVRIVAQQLLLKICYNIIQNPHESRYRKVRLANAIVSSRLLPAAGAIECLFEAGFIESDDGFILPKNNSLMGVKELYHLLNLMPTPKELGSVSSAPKDSKRASTSSEQDKPAIKYQKRENSFLLHLMDHFRTVLRYDDKTLQNKVRTVVPLEKIQFSAMEKMRQLQKELKAKQIQDDIIFEDVLMTELLNWFKFKFFTWVDILTCQNCMSECYHDGSRVSTSPQISRIEIHRCKNCKHENQFPRYTDPEPLLYTRKGRCGEWANCFTLICRTVGFDVRLVYDETDHVWTEIWSTAHNRWIHADVCENLLDKPLIYEKGWGKKLTYVIAFSKDEIQDVTWRYTRNFEEVLKRRRHCSEEALTLFIHKLNTERQTKPVYSKARRKFVEKRSALELAGMLIGPPGHKKPDEDTGNEDVYGARTSGSLAWRMSRGEVGMSYYEVKYWEIPRDVFSYQLRYNIIDDAYIALDAATNKTFERRQKWHDGIWHMEGGIFRKEEPDWKMVYLARSPGSESGKITWSFTVTDSTKTCVEAVKLHAKTTTFNGATVKWQVEGLWLSLDKTKEENKVITVADPNKFITMDLHGATKIRVSAVLYGGEGDVAWQHAQLFRQNINENRGEPSFIVHLDLTDKDE